MRILIVDDDESILTALRLLLLSEGMGCVACRSPAEALAAVRREPFNLALVDLNYVEDTTSGKEGLSLIAALRDAAEDLPVVAMTGWGTIGVAVEAIRSGAVDFVEKPWDNNRLLTTIRTQLKIGALEGREKKLRAENTLLYRQDADRKIISRSEEMSRLLSMAQRVAQSSIPILITGENGTGKSLLASYIHHHSTCANGPFISVNMGSISESTFESEMYGHTKGAYTDAKTERVGRVELADQGTLFLDEIANLPLTQQAKILRLLEERSYEKLGSSFTKKANIRFVSATNADLDALIAERNFRQDLLYRLNGVTLKVPSLRERPADIQLLAEDCLKQARERYRTPAREFSSGARAALEKYAWPGNIRELQHVVERSVLFAQQQAITERDLQLEPPPAWNDTALEGIDGLTLEQAEVWFIRQTLSRHDGNAVAAAKALGISRSALYRRLGKRESV
ncbi:MAG: sigma-54-dependent Fis family transcriptional regulator [Xanthomonadales bacterium]|nr:sigma-54-dependent Fis family transcriptional regulator [Xanthomonadales bacterium]